MDRNCALSDFMRGVGAEAGCSGDGQVRKDS